MRSIVLVFALLGCAAVLPASAVRTLSQASGSSRPVVGTSVIQADTTTRRGSGAGLLRPGGAADLQFAAQAAIRQGSTGGNQLASKATTREAGRQGSSVRSAVGSQAAASAVQQAVAGGGARQGTKAAAGIAEVTAQGRGQTITSSGNRASISTLSAQQAVQAAAQGRTTAGQATATGQSAAQASQIRTSFNPTTGVGARANQG